MITKNKEWQDNVALQRYAMITPLISEDIDNAKRIALRNKIAKDDLHCACARCCHALKSLCGAWGLSGDFFLTLPAQNHFLKQLICTTQTSKHVSSRSVSSAVRVGDCSVHYIVKCASVCWAWLLWQALLRD